MTSLTIQEPRRLIREAVRCVKTASDMRWVARVNGSPLDHARHAQFLRWAALKRHVAARGLAPSITKAA